MPLITCTFSMLLRRLTQAPLFTCRSYVCHEPVLVFLDVFPKYRWHCQRHGSRLGEFGWRCDANLYDLGPLQPDDRLRDRSKHGLADGDDRSSCPLRPVRSDLEALVLGHPHGKAIRCGRDGQDQEAVSMGLCWGAEGHPRGCDDHATSICLRWGELRGLTVLVFYSFLMFTFHCH